MKYKYGQRQFLRRGYYVDTVGKNTKAIKEYIANQLKEDKLRDDLSSKVYIDLFTGKKVKLPAKLIDFYFGTKKIAFSYNMSVLEEVY